MLTLQEMLPTVWDEASEAPGTCPVCLAPHSSCCGGAVRGIAEGAANAAFLERRERSGCRPLAFHPGRSMLWAEALAAAGGRPVRPPPRLPPSLLIHFAAPLKANLCVFLLPQLERVCGAPDRAAASVTCCLLLPGSDSGGTAGGWPGLSPAAP